MSMASVVLGAFSVVLRAVGDFLWRLFLVLGGLPVAQGGFQGALGGFFALFIIIYCYIYIYIYIYI